MSSAVLTTPQSSTATAPPASKTVYVYYQGDINTNRVNVIVGIITQVISNEKPDNLYLLLSSHGGEVDAGVTLYNFLKSIPVKVITHNIGTIDSIANVIFVAGQERYAAPHAVFLFHGVNVGINGNISLPQLNELRDRILSNHKTIAGIICGNTTMNETTIKKLFSQGQTKDVDFAVQNGLINEVKLPQIPQNAIVVAININN